MKRLSEDLKQARKVWEMTLQIRGLPPVTFEEFLEIERESEKLQDDCRARSRRPADWTEPSMTLEEVERDPIIRDFATQMREKGMTVVTRSQYMLMVHGAVKPYGWDAEAESDLPNKLYDPYLFSK